MQNVGHSPVHGHPQQLSVPVADPDVIQTSTSKGKCRGCRGNFVIQNFNEKQRRH